MAKEVRLQGYRELLKACDKGPKDVKKEVRSTFRKVGEVIRVPWRTSLERYGQKTATGLRTSVSQRGVAVRQSRRKSAVESRRRPNFGRLQQDLGDQILLREIGRIEGEFNDAIDKVADNFER
jgi:hypothetical protein